MTTRHTNDSKRKEEDALAQPCERKKRLKVVSLRRLKVLRDDGNVNVSAVYEMCLLNYNEKRIVTGDTFLLKMREHVIFTVVGTQNPALYNFSSYLWEEVLKSQFHSDRPVTPLMENLRISFIPEMREYAGEATNNVSLFPCYVRRLQDTGLRFTQSDNFYHVPAILRVLAPRHETLASSDQDRRVFFMKACLKGLPQKVIMRLWEDILKDSNPIAQLTSASQVSFFEFFELLMG